jgi:hypothetical protein
MEKVPLFELFDDEELRASPKGARGVSHRNRDMTEKTLPGLDRLPASRLQTLGTRSVVVSPDASAWPNDCA